MFGSPHMDRFGRKVAVLVTAAAVGMSGCGLSKQRKMTYEEIEDSSVYDSTTLQLEDPTVSSDDPFGVSATAAPMTIEADQEHNYKEMRLEDVIHTALQNSRVLRDLGGVVLKSPSAARTIHDPAIVESDPRFGTESTLAAFDPVLSASEFAQKNNRALNNVFFGGGTRLLQQDADVAQVSLSKRTATGGTLSLTNNTSYDSNNAPGNEFFSSWNTNIEASVRQPLLQGAGVDYNRIIGPNGIAGLPSGVLLARINSDASLADFESGVRNFVSDVENSYWDLYYAYRDLDAKVAARDAALETWRRVAALKAAGRRGGEAQPEAQAREQHYRLQEEVQNALTGRQVEGTKTNSGSSGGTFRGSGGVYTCERRLRLMMGMPITDGQLIRPLDEPKMSKAVFEWEVALAEALTRRPELRKQKWIIKHREMSLLASRNFLLPQLDASGLYRMRGFGKDLFDTPDNRYPGIFSSAWANLASAKFQEWQLGVEFSMPLGFRKGHAAVRNAELQLSRERAILDEQERQVVLDLSNAISEMYRAHTVLETNYNRRVAAKQQLAAIREIPDPSPQMLYIELDAQRKLAESEAQYYRALIEYELAIKNVHYEKGSILEYNGIYLSELPSPAKAYKDAYEKIKMRTRSARWAQNAASGHIVSEGLVPQKYSPDDASAVVKSKPPALPPADATPDSSAPMDRGSPSPKSRSPISPVPESPVPLPQARRESLTTSRPADDSTANDADETAYEDLAPDDDAALSELPAEPVSAELPEPVAAGESAALDDEDDAGLPDGAADQVDMTGDAAETGDAAGPGDAGEPEDETNEIPSVDDVP